MNLYNFHEAPDKLDHFNKKHDIVPALAIEHGLETGDWNEKVIAKDSQTSYQYAYYKIAGKFKLGEPAIARDAEYSFIYARDILKSRFILGEKQIAKDRICARKYNKLFGTQL